MSIQVLFKDNKGVVHKHDTHGNLIYETDGNTTTTYEYDMNDRIIHSKRSDGYEEIWEYNEKGQILKYIDNNMNLNYEYFGDKLVHFKNLISGAEWKIDIDNKGREIHFSNNTAVDSEWWNEYDDKGELILHNDSSGHENKIGI